MQVSFLGQEKVCESSLKSARVLSAFSIVSTAIAALVLTVSPRQEIGETNDGHSVDVSDVFKSPAARLASSFVPSNRSIFFKQNDGHGVGDFPRHEDPRPSEADRKRVNEPGTITPEPSFPSHDGYEDLEWITYGERRVIIIADSAMAGIRWYQATDALVGADYELYLESCRRLVRRSCKGREGFRPHSALRQIERLDEARNHRDVLVIATGYNDWEGRFASAGHGSDDLGAVMSAARQKSFKNVIWVTLRSNSRYRLPEDSPLWYADYRAMNEAVRSEASTLFPELSIWDLDLYTNIASSEGFFYRDGVHEQRLGSWLVADWISRHVASLDERPCPQPWAPGLDPDESCPNPDLLSRTQGFPDIAALYGLPSPLNADLPPLRSPV